MRDRNYHLLSLLLIALFGLKLSAQVTEELKDSSPFTIQGEVRDSISGETLIGVNIYLKDTKYGTVSDSKGNFSLEAPGGNYTMVFSYLGFKVKEIRLNLNENRNINVVLQTSETSIEEVRISAQRQFFGNLETGRSIQKVSARDVMLESSGNVSDMLQARLSGIWASKTSGAPGDHIKIRIRGMGSLFASDDPLYVVDGVQVPNVNLRSLGVAHLNINDIENITVLKDASSTALYGFQGGNGVIIIDTKRGSADKEIFFSTKIGFQIFSNFYDLMNTHDFLASMDSSRALFHNSLRSRYPQYSDNLESIDWQDEIFRVGRVNEYQLSGSGTLGKINYYLSGNYYHHQGVVRESDYDKYNFAANLGRQFGKRINIELSLKHNIQNSRNNLEDYMGNDLLWKGIAKPPCLNDIPGYLFYVRGDYDTLLTNYIDYDPLRTKYDPRSYLANVNKELSIVHSTVHLFFNYRITDQLNFNFSTSYSGRNQYYNLDIKRYYYSGSPYFLGSDENYRVVNHQYNLTYVKDFHAHSLRCVAGVKSYTDNVFWTVDSLNYPYMDVGKTFDPGSALSQGTMAIHGVEGAVIRSITSYVGHINYSYKQRYNVSVAMNYDFLKEGHYVELQQLFPSVALNWNLANESWFPLHRVNRANLYINYGIAGNYPLNALSNDLYYPRNYTYLDEIAEGYMVDQLANHYLRHEKVSETNLGVEFSAFQNRLGFTTDLFYKTLSDLIINREIPLHYGGGQIFLNAGEIVSKGIDASLEAIPVTTSLITWQTRLNLSITQQHIEKLDMYDTVRFQSDDLLFPEFRLIAGGKLGDIYGYRYLGKYDPEADYSDFPDFDVSGGGMFETMDSGSGPFGEENLVKIGNSIPRWSCNFSTSLTYGNFSVDMLWYGVFGVQKYNATHAATFITGVNSDINELVADSVKLFELIRFYHSSFFIENAGFIRLKTLSISYEPQKKVFNYARLKLSLSFENILTLTRYTGYDPETTIYTDNLFSDNAVDRGAYPIPKAVYLSISLRL